MFFKSFNNLIEKWRSLRCSVKSTTLFSPNEILCLFDLEQCFLTGCFASSSSCYILPNTHQQSWIKLRTSSVLTLRLKQSETYHFRKIVLWSMLLALWYNRNRFYRDMPCFIHLSDGISAVLCMRILLLLCESYLVESQYFQKIYSQSRGKTRHMNTDQSTLTSRRTEIAYLWYLFVTILWYWIPTSITRLYLR